MLIRFWAADPDAVVGVIYWTTAMSPPARRCC
jgi:hypothetical protein